jgi:uncharacterized protein YegL
MKTNILLAGLVFTTVGAVLVYPTLRGQATPVAHAVSHGAPPAQTKRVEVVFVLDTTGSMGGLIAAAKEKIWSIASTLAQAKQAPEISMGLVAYRDRGDAYVTQVIDLDKDLDSMYAKLMQFRADGGGDSPESVNQALGDATTKISWSQDADTYRVIFLVGDAPPHMDYQDDVKYPTTVAAAAAKGIVVNTIQCGGMRETVKPWQEIAALGHGRYFTVDQAGSAVAVATPFDDKIATLAAELDSTRLYYGNAEEKAKMASKTAASDELHASASPAAQARRGVFNASEAGASNLLGGAAEVDRRAAARQARGRGRRDREEAPGPAARYRRAREGSRFVHPQGDRRARRRGWLARPEDLRRGPRASGAGRARVRRRAEVLGHSQAEAVGAAAQLGPLRLFRSRCRSGYLLSGLGHSSQQRLHTRQHRRNDRHRQHRAADRHE